MRPKSNLGTLAEAAGMCFVLWMLACPAPGVSGQSTESRTPQETGTQSSKRTYVVPNGTSTQVRIEESEKSVTRDGEVEKQRVRVPSWSGDRRVTLEREVRTKKAPDGTIEKEYILKNPDGTDRLVPIEIIREKIKKNGDAAIVEREVLKPDYAGQWRTIRKERVTEAGPETARQSLKEVREPTLTGGWRVVEREAKTEKSGPETKEAYSVRQMPDTYGRLADYEVRQERVVTRPGQETREVTLRRRDFQDTHHSKSYLVEKTVSERTESAEGATTVRSTRESELLAGGATRNVGTGRPLLVEEKVEKDIPIGPGTRKTTLDVKERSVVDSRMQPSYRVTQTTDRDGNVRQVFVPLR